MVQSHGLPKDGPQGGKMGPWCLVSDPSQPSLEQATGWKTRLSGWPWFGANLATNAQQQGYTAQDPSPRNGSSIPKKPSLKSRNRSPQKCNWKAWVMVQNSAGQARLPGYSGSCTSELRSLGLVKQNWYKGCQASLKNSASTAIPSLTV